MSLNHRSWPLNARMDAQAKKADAPDSEPGAIVGKVTDIAYPDFHNLEGVVVTVKNDKLLAAEGGERTLTTDSTGEYRFDNLLHQSF